MSDTCNFPKLMTFFSPVWFWGQQQQQIPDNHRRADPASPWNIINSNYLRRVIVWLYIYIHIIILYCSTLHMFSWQSIYPTCRRSGFDFPSRQTQVIKTGSDSITTKRSARSVCVTYGSLSVNGHIRCVTLRNFHCLMAMSAEYRLQFDVFQG